MAYFNLDCNMMMMMMMMKYVLDGDKQLCAFFEAEIALLYRVEVKQRFHSLLFIFAEFHNNTMTVFYDAMHVVLAQYCYRKSSVRLSVTFWHRGRIC